MRFRKQLAAFAVAIAIVTPSQSGEILDRVVAKVNGRIVLQSDWEQELAFENLLNGRAPDTFTPEERKAALDRLIDQELLREQLQASQPAAREQVASRLAQVRKMFPDASTDQAWRNLLQKYGLNESALEKRLAGDIQLMHLVEARLRPSIQIDQNAVESYYHDQLLPELKKAGGREVALAEVIGHIRELLAEQKLNQLLTNWLTNLRSEGHIETRESDAGDQSQ